MDMAEYLEEGEVQKLIDSAPTLQKRTFLACMYESGARPEEFLRLMSTDLRIDPDGAVLMLRGKTGERRVRIIAFSKLLAAMVGSTSITKTELLPAMDKRGYELQEHSFGPKRCTKNNRRCFTKIRTDK